MNNSIKKTSLFIFLIGIFAMSCSTKPIEPAPFSSKHDGTVDGQELATKIEQMLIPLVSSGDASGALRIERDGKLFVEASYGYANLELGALNRPETHFVTGSIAKSITATLILRLAEKNQLALTAPVSDYLPALQGADSYSVMDVLQHRAGLPRDIPLTEKDTLERDGLINWMNNNLDAESQGGGAEYSYSNIGYRLLAVLAEKVSGKPYNELVELEITSPLKIGGWCINEACTNRQVAKGYSVSIAGWDEAGSTVGPIGTSGVLMTTEAMIDWIEILDKQTIVNLQPEGSPPLGGYGRTLEIGETVYTQLQGSEYGGAAGVIHDSKNKVSIAHASNISSFAQWTLHGAIAALLADEKVEEKARRPKIVPIEGEHQALVGTFMHPRFGRVRINEHDDTIQLTVYTLEYTWDLLPVADGAAFWPFFGTTFSIDEDGGLDAIQHLFAEEPIAFSLSSSR